MPAPTGCDLYPAAAEQYFESAADRLDFQTVQITAPTRNEWSSGHLFAGSFRSGYGISKTHVPRFMYNRIICRNDPINAIDPDGRDVINHNNYTVWAKHSETGDVFPVYANSTYIGAQDGGADPIGHPGTVFKSVDGINIIFQENGDIDTYGGTLIQKAGQIAPDFLRGGGEKTSEWNKERHEEKDHGWDNLFDKANDPASSLAKDLQKQAEQALQEAALQILQILF